MTRTKEKSMNRLDGKIALITGGNSGIGLATAKQFVGEGAYVFVTGRRDSELAAAVKEIGRNVTGVQGDVSDLADLDRLFAQIKQHKGRLDVVFANAGLGKLAAFGDITEELYDLTFDINVKGLLFTVQKALPLLPDGASIILNASIVASKGLPANSVYSATKAAVRSFARTWTTDLKARRIRVNAVSPAPSRYGSSCASPPLPAKNFALRTRRLFFQPVAFDAEPVDPVEHPLQQGFRRGRGDAGPLQLQDFLALAPDLRAHPLDFPADGVKLHHALAPPAPLRSAGAERRSAALPVPAAAACSTA
jgi:NAD(P)-dependent dehydrogenase (short-subunit alcohol dehydrogenase family)